MNNESFFDSLTLLSSKVSAGEMNMELAQAQFKVSQAFANSDFSAVNSANDRIRAHVLQSPQESHAMAVLNHLAAIEIGDKRLIARCLGVLARISNLSGRPAECLKFGEDSLALFKKLNDREGESLILGDIGETHCTLGDYQKSIQATEEALHIARQIQERSIESSHFVRLAIVNYYIGSHRRALDYYQRGLIASRELGDRNLESQCLDGLGLAYTALGEFHWALDYLSDAQALAEGNQNLVELVAILVHQAEATRLLGNIGGASEFVERALPLSQNLGVKSLQIDCLNSIGLVQSGYGNYHLSINSHRAALLHAHGIPDPYRVSVSQGNLGLAKHFLNPEESHTHFWDALEIARHLGAKRLECVWLDALGDLYHTSEDTERAENAFRESLTAAKEIGDRRMNAMLWAKLGRVHYALGNHWRAVDYLHHGLFSIRQVENLNGEGIILGNLGAAYHALGQVERGADYYQQALQVAQTVGDRDMERNALTNIGAIYFYDLEDLTTAHAYYTRALEILEEMRILPIEEAE